MCIPSILLYRRMFIALLFLVMSNPVNAYPPEEVYVTISQSKARLLKVFELIEKQTSFSFAYDESDVVLSTEIKLIPGQHPLKIVLTTISKQTGLQFIQKDKLILVNLDEAGIAINNIKASGPVKGVVRDANGQPLAGATVSVKGTTTAVQTDNEGNFFINAPDAGTLLISMIGYKTREVSVSSESLIIVMEITGKDETEVVVVGYTSSRKGDLSGAVSVINVDAISKLPVLSVDQALQGKAAGVRITQATGQPGEGVVVRIRGVGTVNDNNPLFIIDGVPTKDGINFLSANDIQSIVVLKDASSAAIYGARAANGVVIITTKTGKRGKLQFNYSGYGGFQAHGKLPKMTNTAQYVELYNEAVDNDNEGVTNPALLRNKIPPNLAIANTDWLEAIFQKGQIHSHQISVSGGSDKALYYLSGTYFKQEGIILNSWYERYSLLSKLNLDLTDKLSIGNNINVSSSKKNVIGSSGDGYGGNGGSVVRYALFRTPAIPLYDSANVYSDLPLNPQFFGDGYNPVALANKTDNKEIQYRVFTNLFAEYKVARNISFKTEAGVDLIITNTKRFDENYGTNLRVNNPSRLSVNSSTNMNFVWNNILRYNTTFKGVHRVSALLGAEAVTNKNKIHGGTDSKFSQQDPSIRYLGNGLSLTKTVFEGQSEWALFSLFANVNYTYDNRYMVSVNGRRDGSSRFSSKYKYGTFYSGSVGWNVHNEQWIQDNLSMFSKLKLRASYGQLGNQEIGNYPWASTIGNGYNYAFGEPPVVALGSTISSRGNENVKWESSTQADVGIDMGILKDKLNLSVDYFVKTTSGMLIAVPLPLIGGSAGYPTYNAGKVENKGFEAELNYKNNDHPLKYNISLNFATLSNKILSLSDNSQPITGGRIDNGVDATLTAVGHPIGSFYLFEAEGIYQNTAEIFDHAFQGISIKPGDVKFKDQNEDGIIDEKDRTYLGSAIPKYTYGATFNFEYKNFDLSVFFQGAYGNKIYLQVNHDIEGFYRGFNLTERVYDERWHGEGTSNEMPRVSWKGSVNNKTPSSRFLEDGSYVRLKNIQLGYSLPEKMINRFRLKSARFYVTAQNLWTLTKFTGLDPEMHTSDNINSEKYRGDVAAGIDWGTYPSAKSYILGLNINF